MGTVTVIGVGVGSATVTVTATDPHEASDSEDITVTVTAGILTPPTNVEATVSGSGVTVTWTDGAFADVHDVMLISFDFKNVIPVRLDHGLGNPSPMTHTFSDVRPVPTTPWCSPRARRTRAPTSTASTL